MEIKKIGTRLKSSKDRLIVIMDPVTSPMEKRAGRYRAQLLVKSQSRTQLQSLLKKWVEAAESSLHSRKVRWSIDIDPMEMF